jgi:hypothetical protein
MSDIEWLVAIEEIRQLHARRDRYVDALDWEGYALLHAPDHVADHPPDAKTRFPGDRWTSTDEMIAKLSANTAMLEGFSVHHSYDPEFYFETPTRAHAIWAMTNSGVYPREGHPTGWHIQYGYYYDSYEKRDGRWLFTYRRWENYLGIGDRDRSGEVTVTVPQERLKGSDAFDRFERE